MDRRSALRNFVIISAGVVILPKCRDGKVKGTVLLKNIRLRGDQEAMLAHLSETILPVKYEAPADAAHYFVLAMVDDCYSKENQQEFMKGLEEFENLSRKKFDQSFVKCNTEQKHALLNELTGEDVKYFYNTVHSLTVQHYTSSKYYLTNVHKYELVPGRFNGCFPIKKPA